MPNTFASPFRLAAIACAAALAMPVFASTPEAWAAHDKEVAEACIKVSALKGAQPAGLPMPYDDRVRMTALLLTGRYPQPQMKNRVGRELCLYDRETRDAAVTEADQLAVRAMAAPAKAPAQAPARPAKTGSAPAAPAAAKK